MGFNRNIIIFGVDRCPAICRPSLESLFSELPDYVDVYVGFIQLGEKGAYRSNEIQTQKVSFNRLKVPAFQNIKTFQVYLQLI